MTNRFMSSLAVVAAMLSFSGIAAAQAVPYREGEHYVKFDQAVSPRQQDTVIVTEIFSYGCHACNEFEPYIQSWKARQADDVKFARIPVGFGRTPWNMLAQGYLMAEILGVAEETHVPLMDAIWKQGLWNRGTQIRSVEQLADFYESQGVDRAKFLSLDNGFSLSMRESANEKKLQIFQPRQTPTMVVADKYRIQTGESVRSFQEMLQVVDFLVAQERAAMTAAAQPEQAVETGEVATAEN